MNQFGNSSAAKMPSADRRSAAEFILRGLTATAIGAFAISAISHWLAAPTRITLLLMVIANCFTTGLALVARAPAQRDWRPAALLCSLGGTYGCIAYNLNPGAQIVPEFVGALLQIGGIGWQLFAKISLQRSFGILPANRGVVSRGAYQFVRHPMYLGYFLTDLGFLLTNFSLFNLSIHVLQLMCQVSRINQEEHVLRSDPAYRSYLQAVRYRLIPLLF